MPAKVISIPDIGDVHIYKRKKGRNVKLSLDPKGRIRISTPYWLPYSAAVKYAVTKKDWIVKNTVKTELISEMARIGKSHRIRFIEDYSKDSVATRITRTDINIYHPPHVGFHETAVQNAANKASIRALKKQSAVLLPKRLETIASERGFTYSSVDIKQLTGRWGSCSSNKEITLSCFLIQLPWHLIDYVILHELTHTKVMRHGPPFWEEMSLHSNNLKSLRREIKQYHPVIMPLG